MLWIRVYLTVEKEGVATLLQGAASVKCCLRDFTILAKIYSGWQQCCRHNLQDAYWTNTHMTHVSDYIFLPSACTNTEDLGEKVPSTPFTSPHLSLPSFFPVDWSDKAGRPSGCTVLPNVPDLGMRGELVKDNHALWGPLKRSAEGKAIFVLQFCSSLMGSRRVECSGYQRSQSSYTGDTGDKVFPINHLNIPIFVILSVCL